LSLIFIGISGGGFYAGRFVLFVAMTVLGFYSGLVVGKKARRIKADIYSAPDDEQRDRSRSAFKKIHAKSAILNMVILAFGLVIVYLTAITL